MVVNQYFIIVILSNFFDLTPIFIYKIVSDRIWMY